MNSVVSSKKGFVFSMLVIFGSIVMFIYLDARFHNPSHDEAQEFDNTRISRISNEFTFMKNSVIPEIIRYSGFFATQDLLEILSTDLTARTNARGNYSYIQNRMLELMENGTFEGNPRVFMENKTIANLMEFYTNFSNQTLRVNYTYQLRGTRIYEKTPLFLSVEMEVYQKMVADDIELIIEEADIVDVSFPLNSLKDPQVLLYKNSFSNEVLTDAKSRANYDGEWNWELLNETYEDGLVTIFTYPEYQYTIGTSFLRSIVNSTQRGKYYNILSFLSFEYEQDSTPYDTKNYYLTHELYTRTLFLATFNNISFNPNSDETLYENHLDVSRVGDNCTIMGSNQNGCRLNGLRPLQNLRSSGSNFTFSTWINYTASGVVIDSNGFRITTDATTQNATVELFTQTLGVRVLNGVRIKPNEWINVIIQGREDGFVDVMINGVSQIKELLEIEDSLQPFDEIQIGDASFDEIVFSNHSMTISQIATLLSSRTATFVEYKDSLFERGFELTGNEHIELNASLFNESYPEFAAEFWFYMKELSSGNILKFTNSTSSNEFIITINNDDLQIQIADSSDFLTVIASNLNLTDERYKHLLVQLVGSEIRIILNSNIVATGTYTGEFGGYDSFILFNSSSSLSGLVDEFVLYNRSLTNDEIHAHYYNFKSEVGGCCNYFKMVNENKHGSISTQYPLSTIFLPNGTHFNLSLTILGQKNSSYPATANWYGRQVDNCQIYIYNLQDYVDMVSVKVGSYGNTCQELIERGVY